MNNIIDKVLFSSKLFLNFSFIDLYEVGYVNKRSGNYNNGATVQTVVFVFAWFLAYCEFGERITDELDEFRRKLSQCRWYSFSIEMQRSYLITLSCTHQSVVIQGFANTACTRDTFKAVNL